MHDAFSRCHPVVNFIFFALAIVWSVILLHPLYLAVSLVCAAACYIGLKGRRSLRVLLGFLPVFLILSAINPLFNTQGSNILFTWFGRPYTMEALYYGAVLAAMLVSVMLWFLSYSIVMTSDKFTALFAPILPSVSLLLVMIMRLVPAYWKKARQFSGARQCIGMSGTAGRRSRLRSGGDILSALSTWALEGSIITADSMRCRGYGAAKRTSFCLYRWTARDLLLVIVMVLLSVIVTAAAAHGCAAARFTPYLSIAGLNNALAYGGIFAWGLMLLIPTILQGKERVSWHISKSNI